MGNSSTETYNSKVYDLSNPNASKCKQREIPIGTGPQEQNILCLQDAACIYFII